MSCDCTSIKKKVHVINFQVGDLLTLGVAHNCHHFHECTLGAVGGRGSRATVRFFKMSFMMHCDFEKGSRNQHFQSTLFVGREGSDKRSLCVCN